VPGELHPEDFIFWFIHDQPHMADKSQAVREYFQSGKDGAVFVRDLLNEYRPQQILNAARRPGGKLSLLEFASGYGRVTRHFKAAMPDFDVTACDIHPQAVEFLERLGLPAVQSRPKPEDFGLGRTFDVVYAFSFFTHMPRATWGRWLKALERHVSPGGILMFSTHGRLSQQLMGVPFLEPDGFFFHAVSEQKDLELAEYGNTVTTFDYVYRQIEDTELKIVQFREAGAGHHDIYILQRGTIEAGESGELARLRKEIAELRASHSWRVTAPLRALRRRFGRADRGGDA